MAETSHAEGCGCIAKVNASLDAAGLNTKVEQLFRLQPTIGESHALIRTIVAEKKRGARPTTIEASFCPFCGVKYPEAAVPAKDLKEESPCPSPL